MHSVERGPLQQTSRVAWSVCLSVCVLGTRMCSAELIEIPFGELTLMGPGSMY